MFTSIGRYTYEQLGKNKMYVAYYRVSTDRQGKSGLGLEAQREAINNYISRSDQTVDKEFVEIESGSKSARPELKEAIEYCRKHKKTLIIAKLDRLSRNLHFISGLMEANIDFVAVDNPHANKLMVHLLAAFAEHEREIISERTKVALAAAKQRGVKLGTYGKVLAERNIRLADEHAKELAPTIQKMQTNGIKSIRSICKELNALNIPTARNNKWFVSTMHQLLKRIEKLELQN